MGGGVRTSFCFLLVVVFFGVDRVTADFALETLFWVETLDSSPSRIRQTNRNVRCLVNTPRHTVITASCTIKKQIQKDACCSCTNEECLMFTRALITAWAFAVRRRRRRRRLISCSRSSRVMHRRSSFFLFSPLVFNVYEHRDIAFIHDQIWLSLSLSLLVILLFLLVSVDVQRE